MARQVVLVKYGTGGDDDDENASTVYSSNSCWKGRGRRIYLLARAACPM